MWGVPSPVVVDRGFAATVGVKCSAGCPLAGRAVVVRDEAGDEAGRGRLGETPAPGTSALHAVEVALKAPAREGVHTWTAVFDCGGPGPTTRETDPAPGGSPARAAATPENARPTTRETVPAPGESPARAAATPENAGPTTRETTPARSSATAEQQTPAAPEATPVRVAATAGQQAPAAPEAAATEALAGTTTCSTGREAPAAREAAHAHEAAAAAFSFRAVSPPEHRVTVTVRDRDTDALLPGAEVRVGVHRGTTGADGRAQVDARAGAGDLYVRKAGYAPHAGSVEVSGDAALQVVVARVSDADPDEEQVWM